MSRKIPAKPFSSQEGKAQNPIKATRQEPNASSIAGNTKTLKAMPTPPSQASAGSQNRSKLWLPLLVLIALAGGYLGFMLAEFNAPGPNVVAIAETELTYSVGDTGRLTARVSGEFDRYDLFWTSSNLEIVYVDNGGNLAALAPGQAVITAAVGSGSVKDTIIINVIE